MREASRRATPDAATSATCKPFAKEGTGCRLSATVFAGEFISRRNGGTRMERPTVPRMHPSAGIFRGYGASRWVPRSWEVQARSSAKVDCENRMLTWVVRGIIWYLLVEAGRGLVGVDVAGATSSCASEPMGPGSHWPLRISECGG